MPHRLLSAARRLFGFGTVAIVCGIVFAAMLGQLWIEKAPIEAVLRQAMAAGQTRDAQAFYALMSADFHAKQTDAAIARWLDGEGSVLFSGYRDLALTEITLTWSTATVATVSALVAYDDGSTGEIQSVLVKEDGAWQIESLTVNIPLDKADAGQRAGHQ